MGRTETPALGESRRQRLLPVPYGHRASRRLYKRNPGSFPKLASILGYRPTGPVAGQQTLIHKAMKRSKWPIRYPLDQARLDGVVMKVIDMPSPVLIVTKGMLPIAPLP
jgi:hypothetical protein